MSQDFSKLPQSFQEWDLVELTQLQSQLSLFLDSHLAEVYRREFKDCLEESDTIIETPVSDLRSALAREQAIGMKKTFKRLAEYFPSLHADITQLIDTKQ